MNILILAAGTRNAVVRYFKEALKGGGTVVATDASSLAPALYEADKCYVVPPITAEGYIDVILDICKKERIDGVLSLIDPELSLLAAHEAEFRAVGAVPIGSSYELCELSLDKMQMNEWLTAHGYRCAKSWSEREAFYAAVEAGEVSYPVFLKPIRGSASVFTYTARDRESVDFLFTRVDGLMIQEYMNGQELGADVYIDLLSREVVSIFTKKKIRMRAGETDKSVSFKDPKLFALLESFVSEAGFRGEIDVDLFDIDGKYVISEVNPRFGGGYPHAHECGCHHTELILNNLRGVANEKHIGAYKEGVYMMKYNAIKIMDETGMEQ